MSMPQYIFRLDPASEDDADAIVQTLENDEVAVHVARRMLDVGRASVRVGRGAGEAVQWLGAWETQSRRAAWRDEA
jgi:hypothetical protein